MSGKVQNANTHILRGAKITSTRTAAGQFQGEFNGAMERYTWVRFAGKLTPCHANIWRRSAYQRGDGTLHMWVRFVWESSPPATQTHGDGQQTSGAMDDSSGKGSKVQAHIISGVVMDITAFKASHSVDIDATALRAKKPST